MSIKKQLQRWFFTLPEVPRVPGRINILMIVNAKKNQGFYRDAELARQTNAVRIFEDFPYEDYDWDARRIVEAIYGDDLPDVIYIHYNRNHTHKIKHMDKVPVVKWGFVGDPQDFIVEDEKEVMVPWSNCDHVPGWEPKVSLEEGLRGLLDGSMVE